MKHEENQKNTGLIQNDFDGNAMLSKNPPPMIGVMEGLYNWCKSIPNITGVFMHSETYQQIKGELGITETRVNWIPMGLLLKIDDDIPPGFVLKDTDNELEKLMADEEDYKNEISRRVNEMGEELAKSLKDGNPCVPSPPRLNHA